MGGRDGLGDRLHREMIASKRAWTSEEIARSTLKIVSGTAASARLVEAILSGDPRFERDGGSWRARPAAAPRLDALAFLLADAAGRKGTGLPVVLAFQAYERGPARSGDVVLAAPDAADLRRLAGWLERRIVVSLEAPAVRRGLHDLERLHALPAASERLLDLAAVLALEGEPPPEACTGEGTAPVEERLQACRSVLEATLDRYGAWPLDRLERELEGRQKGEPIDFSRFRFSPDLLGEIPAQPGIYRFLGEEEKLLYVGKSRDLRRRIAGYFRPLAPDHQRRARLLAEVRGLEWETTPSELEALVLESEAIRRQHPSHNRQTEVHPGRVATDSQDADLAFVLAEADAESVSVFFLRDRRPWALARLPRIRSVPDPGDAGALVRAWIERRLDPSLGLHPLEEAEGLLVQRYLRIFGDRVDRIRLTDVPAPEEAGEALLELATRRRPAAEPWILRSPADESD